MEKIKCLILLRGLPGSGKSTFANVISEEGKYPIFSVDDYFTNSETGEYQFDFKLNYIAYQQCEANTKTAMENGVEKIIVHNTFTLDWEMEPYFKLAVSSDYRLFVLTMEKHHTNENIHEISQEQIQKMAEKYKVKLF